MDKVIVLQSPHDFNAIGEFYEKFQQVNDFQVQEIMIKHGYNIELM